MTRSSHRGMTGAHQTGLPFSTLGGYRPGRSFSRAKSNTACVRPAKRADATMAFLAVCFLIGGADLADLCSLCTIMCAGTSQFWVIGENDFAIETSVTPPTHGVSQGGAQNDNQGW